MIRYEGRTLDQITQELDLCQAWGEEAWVSFIVPTVNGAGTTLSWVRHADFDRIHAEAIQEKARFDASWWEVTSELTTVFAAGQLPSEEALWEYAKDSTYALSSLVCWINYATYLPCLATTGIHFATGIVGTFTVGDPDTRVVDLTALILTTSTLLAKGYALHRYVDLARTAGHPVNTTGLIALKVTAQYWSGAFLTMGKLQ